MDAGRDRGPSPRIGAAMAGEGNRVRLHGGRDFASYQASHQAGCLDRTRHRLMLFGGSTPTSAASDELWELDTKPHDTFGTGCAPGRPAPSLTLGPAVLGLSLGGAVNGIGPEFAAMVLGFGLDDQSYAGSPVPLALDTVGLPGCTLWMAPLITTFEAFGFPTNGAGFPRACR